MQPKQASVPGMCHTKQFLSCTLIEKYLQIAEEGEVTAEAPVQDVAENKEETEENTKEALSEDGTSEGTEKDVAAAE